MSYQVGWNSRNCDNREAGNWSGYLSESSQTHSEKSRLDFLSLPGKTNLKAKTTLFATSKKSPDTKRPNSHKRRGRWRLKEFLGFMLNQSVYRAWRYIVSWCVENRRQIKSILLHRYKQGAVFTLIHNYTTYWDNQDSSSSRVGVPATKN